jgi:hypothetical protein
MQLLPLIRNLKILTQELQTVPFEPNWAQIEYLRVAEEQLATTGRVRIIVLKARQLGISTVTEALAFTLAFLYNDYRAYVLAHEIPASQNLLIMTRRYWDTYPFKALYGAPKHASRNTLAWDSTGSSIHIGTAGNKATGRSNTLHFLHASEVAFWPNPREVFLSVRQTVPQSPGTGIVLESTANGMGDLFQETWLASENGDTEYTPLFFPWHRHPRYTASYIGIPYATLGHLSSEERALVSMGISDDRLAWRRWAIRNLCQNDLLKFMQEYPATPEEAFIASGTNVFPYDHLAACYEPLQGYKGMLRRNGNQSTFHSSQDGPLTIFSRPSPDQDWGAYYLVAGDPTHTTRGDFAVAQVINRRTMEQVAVWRARIDPGTFAEELFKLGMYYNIAMVSNEIEGPGYMTIGKLLGMNYPKIPRRTRADNTPGKLSENYGWSTTVQSKNLMIGTLLKYVVDRSITIHDKNTFTEMQNYVTLDNGGYGPAQENGYDDCVMSLAQAVAIHDSEPPLMAYGQGAVDVRSTPVAPTAVVTDTGEIKHTNEPAWTTWGEDSDTGS